MQFKHIRLSLAALAVASSIPLSALATTYTVTKIDYTDPVTLQKAAYTWVWGVNDNSLVVGQASMNDPSGGSGVFNFIYDFKSGNYLAVPQPPGIDPSTSFAAIGGINAAGDIAGTLFQPTGQQAFLLTGGHADYTTNTWAGGSYAFYSYPGLVNTQGRSIGNYTDAYPKGIAVGNAYLTGGPVLDSSRPFIYDPATGRFADLPLPGSYLTTAGGINLAGQVTGNVRYQNGSGGSLANGQWAFLYTPTNGTDPFQGGAVSYFQIKGVATRARGINDNGLIALSVIEDIFRTYVADSSGYQEIVMPGNVNPDCTLSAPQGINKWGQVTGPFTDEFCNTHGFIASPANVPTGTTSNGAYTFNVDVVADTPIFIDPPVALGYKYAIGAGNPMVATVRLPVGIGDNKFRIVVGGNSYRVNAGELFDFRARGFLAGVDSFEVKCIDPAAMLDPVNSLAFPTQLSFVGAGKFTGTQQPVARNIPNPAYAAQLQVHQLCLANGD